MYSGSVLCKMAEVIPSKRQADLERFQQRLQNYRRHNNDCARKYQSTFEALVEQDVDQTLYLKQKFLQNKEKRAAKKKLPDNQNGSQNYYNNSSKKRDEDFSEPPSNKMAKVSEDRGGGKSNSNNSTSVPVETLSKFPASIGQRLDFSANIATQISPNSSAPNISGLQKKPDSEDQSIQHSQNGPRRDDLPNNNQMSSTIAHSLSDHSSNTSCKQEKDYADLADLQLAIERDCIPFDLDDDVGDTIISQDAIKALISDIINDPKDMKDIPMQQHQQQFQSQMPHFRQHVNQQSPHSLQHFPHIQHQHINVTEMNKTKNVLTSQHSHVPFHMQSPHLQHRPPLHQQLLLPQQTAVNHSNNRVNRMPFNSQSAQPGGYNAAAQTLKHMAEQHNKQNMNIGISYRSPSPSTNTHLKGHQQQQQFTDFLASSTGANQSATNSRPSPSSMNPSPSTCCASSQTVASHGLVTPPPNNMFLNSEPAKQEGIFANVDSIKQEAIYSSNSNSPVGYSPGAANSSSGGKQIQNRSQRSTPPVFKQQPYSPYGSPSNHSSPQYPPRVGSATGPSPVSPKTPGASQQLQVPISQTQTMHANSHPTAKSVQTVRQQSQQQQQQLHMQQHILSSAQQQQQQSHALPNAQQQQQQPQQQQQQCQAQQQFSQLQGSPQLCRQMQMQQQQQSFPPSQQQQQQPFPPSQQQQPMVAAKSHLHVPPHQLHCQESPPHMIRPPPPEYNTSGRQVMPPNIGNFSSHMNPATRGFNNPHFTSPGYGQRLPQPSGPYSPGGMVTPMGNNMPPSCALQQQQRMLTPPRSSQLAGPPTNSSSCRQTRPLNNMMEWGHMIHRPQHQQIQPSCGQRSDVMFSNGNIHMRGSLPQQMCPMNNGMLMGDQHRAMLNSQPGTYPVPMNARLMSPVNIGRNVDMMGHNQIMVSSPSPGAPNFSFSPDGRMSYRMPEPLRNQFLDCANAGIGNSSILSSDRNISPCNNTRGANKNIIDTKNAKTAKENTAAENSANNHDKININNVHTSSSNSSSNNNNNNKNTSCSVSSSSDCGNNDPKFPAEFSLDFLDHFNSTDTSHLNDSEFFNSLNFSDLI